MKSATESGDTLSLDEARISRLRKLSSPLISDVMNKSGMHNQVIAGIFPLGKGMKACGKAFTAIHTDKPHPAPRLFENNRYMLDEIPANKSRVLLIENKGTPNIAASWGFLVSLYAKHRGITGIITNGQVRDYADIENLNYPVFCTGPHHQNSNQSYKVISLQNRIQLHGVIIHPDDFILADDSGIAVIPCSMIDNILLLAEQKQQDEIIIAKLMNNGLTLREIDEVMKTNQPKQILSSNSIFNNGEKISSHRTNSSENIEKQIFIKSCL